jgi:hypothetical protein
MNTASQVLGAILGSSLFAASLRGIVPAGAHLALSAICFALAALAIIPAMRAEQQCSTGTQPKSQPHWLKQTEGMHGMDATLPAPTARGSMLLRHAVRKSFVWTNSCPRGDFHQGALGERARGA